MAIPNTTSLDPGSYLEDPGKLQFCLGWILRVKEFECLFKNEAWRRVRKSQAFSLYTVHIRIYMYISHRIHVWYIYLHLPSTSTIHVGVYTSPMDPMGLYKQLDVQWAFFWIEDLTHEGIREGRKPSGWNLGLERDGFDQHTSCSWKS